VSYLIYVIYLLIYLINLFIYLSIYLCSILPRWIPNVSWVRPMASPDFRSACRAACCFFEAECCRLDHLEDPVAMERIWPMYKWFMMIYDDYDDLWSTKFKWFLMIYMDLPVNIVMIMMSYDDLRWFTYIVLHVAFAICCIAMLNYHRVMGI
jgi:hypothetical protein